MTNPVVLYGTQSNGETLPVQVDAFGRLVAEGLQGPEGPPGPPGPDGPPGEIELPPDPYEGALLGWLNGGLAWIGTPPVPIPPGVFGPIIDYDEGGFLTVEGTIPPEVDNGVYLTQVDATGTPIRPDKNWDIRHEWSQLPFVTQGGDGWPQYGSDKAFEGLVAGESLWYAPNGGPNAIFDVDGLFPDAKVVTIFGAIAGSGRIWLNNAEQTWLAPGQQEQTTLVSSGFRKLEFNYPGPGNYVQVCWIQVDGQLLVDQSKGKLEGRVNARVGDNAITIVPSSEGVFTPGSYLKIPEQRVAPWVLYGNDPTSLIDHLRNT